MELVEITLSLSFEGEDDEFDVNCSFSHSCNGLMSFLVVDVVAVCCRLCRIDVPFFLHCRWSYRQSAVAAGIIPDPFFSTSQQTRVLWTVLLSDLWSSRTINILNKYVSLAGQWSVHAALLLPRSWANPGVTPNERRKWQGDCECSHTDPQLWQITMNTNVAATRDQQEKVSSLLFYCCFTDALLLFYC